MAFEDVIEIEEGLRFLACRSVSPGVGLQLRHRGGIKRRQRAGSRPKQIPAQRDEDGERNFDNEAHGRRPRSKREPVVEGVERQLESDEKLAELGVLRADLVEAHLVDDRFDVRGGFCKRVTNHSSSSRPVEPVMSWRMRPE